MTRTEYPLFPLDFALRDARNRTKQATSLVEKKAVLSRIIPALTNSESVKKGEAKKCREFTRCSVIKAFNGDASYQYIDEEKGEAVQFKEYERRYHLYLENGKDSEETEATKKENEAKPQRVLSAIGKLGNKNEFKKGVTVELVVVEKENAHSNVQRGIAEEKEGFHKSSLHDAMWANLSALSLQSTKPPLSSATAARRIPLQPVEPSSPKKERKERLDSFKNDVVEEKEESVLERKHEGADEDDDEEEEDTVDFRSLRVDVEAVSCSATLGRRVGVGTRAEGTGLSSPAEMPSSPQKSVFTKRKSFIDRNGSVGATDAEEEQEGEEGEHHVFSSSDASESRREAEKMLTLRLEQAHAKFRWDLVGIDLRSSREKLPTLPSSL